MAANAPIEHDLDWPVLSAVAFNEARGKDRSMNAIPVDEIMRLPVDERLRLAEDIWDSLRAAPDLLPLTDAQRVELDRRLELYRSDLDQGDDIDDVIGRIRRQK